MIPGAQSPRRISSLVAIVMRVIVWLEVRSRWKGKLHEMGDAFLALSAVDRLHGGLLERTSAKDVQQTG